MIFGRSCALFGHFHNSHLGISVIDEIMEIYLNEARLLRLQLFNSLIIFWMKGKFLDIRVIRDFFICTQSIHNFSIRWMVFDNNFISSTFGKVQHFTSHRMKVNFERVKCNICISNKPNMNANAKRQQNEMSMQIWNRWFIFSLPILMFIQKL